MTKQLGKFIADGSIESQHLTASARTNVLSSKLQATRIGVLGFSAAGTSDVVTTEVTAAATTDTPQTSLAALGIYVGTVSGPSDVKRVLIRQAGTDDGVDDGLSNDVYGKLTESAGVYTLSYYDSANAAFTMPATSIDFFFVEIMSLYTVPADTFLSQGLGGVIDATKVQLIEHVEIITVDSTIETNEYVDLAFIPKAAGKVSLFVKGSGPQVYGDDYTVITDGSDIKRLNWDTLGLDGLIVSGDKLVVRYLYDPLAQ